MTKTGTEQELSPDLLVSGACYAHISGGTFLFRFDRLENGRVLGHLWVASQWRSWVIEGPTTMLVALTHDDKRRWRGMISGFDEKTCPSCGQKLPD